MAERHGKLAVVTGASTGIGLELARCCAEDGYDLVIAADHADIEDAAIDLRDLGGNVTPVMADLATLAGVDQLYATVQGIGRPDAVLANAGRGLGRAFLDQDFDEIRRVIDTNIVGTVYLLQKFGRDMRAANAGHILVTGSIAGLMPGSFQAVYNSSKAFLDQFCYALGNELKDTDVKITVLMPGATETDFFETADMLDTKVGQADKADPKDVAREGFKAMQKGDSHVVAGLGNKITAALSHITPWTRLAEDHRKMAEPGSAKQ